MELVYRTCDVTDVPAQTKARPGSFSGQGRKNRCSDSFASGGGICLLQAALPPAKLLHFPRVALLRGPSLGKLGNPYMLRCVSPEAP